MAQHDYVIANASGATVRADINSMALAISSNNSGSSAPSTTYAYQLWLDTGNSLLKLRNAANNAWITMPLSVTANNTVDINGGTIDGTNIGASSAGTGAFTTISASSTLGVTGVTTLGIGMDIDGSDDLRLRLLNGSTFKGGMQVATSSGDMISGSAVDDLAIRSQGNVLLSAGGNTERMRVSSTNVTITGTADAETGLTATHSRSGVGYTLLLNNTNNGANKGSGIKWQSGGFDTAAIIGRSDATAASSDAPAYMTFHTSADGSEGLNERMRIDSSGNVAIGHTTTTGSKLAICDGSNSQIQFFPEISTDTNLTQHYDPTASAYINAETRAASHSWKIGTTEYAKLLSSGKLAVTEISHISNGSLEIGNGDEKQIFDASGATIQFQTADTERMRIDSSGNVGIGNSSMSSYDSNARNLVVGSGTGDEGMTIASGSGSGGRIYFADGTSGDAQKADGYIFYNHASAYMAFGTVATERMRIDSSGNVGIGESNPSLKLMVQENDASKQVLMVRNQAGTVTSSSAAIVYLQWNGDSGLADGSKFIHFVDADTNLGQITSTSSSTGIAYSSNSDERLKKNIVDASSQLDVVKSVKVREYDWKKNDKHELGFVAQELKTSIPQAVIEGGDDETENPWGVDYGRVTPYLVKAIQEQQEQIELLTTEIQTLKGE